MSRPRKALLGVQLFNGLSAFGGGLALVVRWIPEQPNWVEHTGFANNYFPGVILMAVVGGSALIASLAMIKRINGWQLSSIVAGVIMLVWIAGEVVSIRGFHVLQIVYLLTGALVLWWTPSGGETKEVRD